MMSEERPTRLSDFCKDFFLYLTSFKRNGGEGATVETVRRRLLELLGRADSAIHQEAPDLHEHWRRTRYLLVVTADGILLNSGWKEAESWNLLEHELYQTAVGGERFFQLLDDRDHQHPRLVEVFYLCLGIGFAGQHLGDDNKLFQLRNGLYLRLTDDVPREAEARLTPRAYDYLEPSSPPSLPMVRLLRLMALVACVALICWFGASFVYEQRVQELQRDVAKKRHEHFKEGQREGALSKQVAERSFDR